MDSLIKNNLRLIDYLIHVGHVSPKHYLYGAGVGEVDWGRNGGVPVPSPPGEFTLKIPLFVLSPSCVCTETKRTQSFTNRMNKYTRNVFFLFINE